MNIQFYEITSDMKIVDKKPILFLQEFNALVIADLHLGLEAIMQDDGSYVPHNLTNQIIETFRFYLENLKPNKLILNGDIKHSFQEPTKIENRDVKKFFKEISPLVPEIHVIKGNHDIFLSWALKDFENVISHATDFTIGKYYITHGDKELEIELTEDIKYIIVGHLHPVFESRINGLQKVRNPSFLLGPLKSMTQKILVVPAFTEYSSGSPINPHLKNHHIIPLLRDHADLQDFELFVLGEDEVFHFPKLRLWM